MARKGAMIKEKWEGKVQLENGNVKERYNVRREMGRKGTIRERMGRTDDIRETKRKGLIREEK